MARFRGVGVAVAAVILGTTGVAVAQPADESEPGYIYEFKDELLDSDVMSVLDWQINVRPIAARTTLIRPRTSFVYEMFKSIEAI